MMAYADVTPPPLAGLSPATDAALFMTGDAPLGPALATPFTPFFAGTGRLMGALRGIPFI